LLHAETAADNAFQQESMGLSVDANVIILVTKGDVMARTSAL